MQAHEDDWAVPRSACTRARDWLVRCDRRQPEPDPRARVACIGSARLAASGQPAQPLAPRPPSLRDSSSGPRPRRLASGASTFPKRPLKSHSPAAQPHRGPRTQPSGQPRSRSVQYKKKGNAIRRVRTARTVARLLWPGRVQPQVLPRRESLGTPQPPASAHGSADGAAAPPLTGPGGEVSGECVRVRGRFSEPWP